MRRQRKKGAAYYNSFRLTITNTKVILKLHVLKIVSSTEEPRSLIELIRLQPLSLRKDLSPVAGIYPATFA